MRGKPSLEQQLKQLTIYATPVLAQAAAIGASKRMLSMSAYARCALLDQLASDGIEIAENERVAV